MSRGKFLFTRDVGHRNMTVGQLRNTLTGNNGAQLASKIIHCVQSVRGMHPYWSLVLETQPQCDTNVTLMSHLQRLACTNCLATNPDIFPFIH